MPAWLLTDIEYYLGISLILAGIWRQMFRSQERSLDRREDER